jgi:hypothetical protein
MDERMMNNYLELIWKELVVDEWRYCPRICLEGRRNPPEIHVNMIQERHCYSQPFRSVCCGCAQSHKGNVTVTCSNFRGKDSTPLPVNDRARCCS